MIEKGTLKNGMDIYRVDGWDGGASPMLEKWIIVSVARVFVTMRRDGRAGTDRVQVFRVEFNYHPTVREAVRDFIDPSEHTITAARRTITKSEAGIEAARGFLTARLPGDPDAP